MNTEEITYNNMPDAVAYLIKKIEELEITVKEKITQPVQIVEQEEERPLSVKKAAEFLGISSHTIYKMVNNKEIPFYKNTGKLYFYKKELNEYQKKFRVCTADEIEAKAELYIQTHKYK
jgi:excisionase family DNA binding protein